MRRAPNAHQGNALSAMTSILLVEDEPAIAELVSIHLRHAGYEVLLASDAEQARRRVDQVLPNLVLLDWMLPGESGLALARRWRADPRTRELPLIMLTARTEETDKVAGLEGGADDYITKPFSPRELVARVRAVLRRRAPESTDEAVQILGLSLDPLTRRVSRRMGAPGQETDLALKLSPVEFRLLHFLMTHPERVYNRSFLLSRVWGDHVFIEERTVDVHVKRLREVLTPVHCEHLLETVRGVGYRFTVRPGGD
jgi:two-component system, OmpR family, phosphate regulon response regulator PhoB